MQRFIKNNKGFSLAETMVATMIFLMMASGFYAALAAGDASWQTNTTKMELQSNLRIAMESMIYDLRQAGPASIADLAAGTTGAQLTFRKPAGITNGSITWEANQIRFVRGGASGNDLLKFSGAGLATSKVVTENITALSFTRDGTQTDEITIAMTASKSTLKGIPITYDLSINFQIRN